MGRSLRQIIPSVHWTEEVTLDVLSQVISQAVIQAMLSRLGVSEIRVRKLTMELIVLLCIAMNLFTEEAIDDVMRKLVAGQRFLALDKAESMLSGASAICQRRQQLGVGPMVALYKEVCRPLATPATRDAFLFGLRLMAVDGTVEDVPDTPANSNYFGRQTGSRGDSAFPQMRCVYLCECGTHAICDAGVWPYKIGERSGGLRVLRSVEPGMLVLWDCGFHSFDMCDRTRRQRKAHFLGRVPAHVVFRPTHRLPDGSYLAYIYPSEYKRRKAGERLFVRVIEYIIDDPGRPGHAEHHRLVTSLLNHKRYPAHDLAVAYHERWEVEITIDEVDTHQRHPLRPFRSRTPLAVLQEFYGLLIAHYLIRSIMHEAAIKADVAPDRLSFVHAVRVVRDSVFPSQILDLSQVTEWREQMLREIARKVLPLRSNRSNPRVVKRKMSKFDLKREQHRLWPQPTKCITDAIVLLI